MEWLDGGCGKVAFDAELRIEGLPVKSAEEAIPDAEDNAVIALLPSSLNGVMRAVKAGCHDYPLQGFLDGRGQGCICMHEEVGGDSKELKGDHGRDVRAQHPDQAENHGSVPERFDGVKSQGRGSIHIGVGMMDGMPDPKNAKAVHREVREPKACVGYEEEG